MSNVTQSGPDICSPSRSSKNSDPDYEECIVTYIDILGFRDLLDSKSAADIRQILSIFRREAKPYDPGLPSAPSRRRIVSEVTMEVVSDAVVRARTIYTQYRDGALFHELLELVHIQAACVHQGIFLRGALTIDYVHVGQERDGPLFWTRTGQCIRDGTARSRLPPNYRGRSCHETLRERQEALEGRAQRSQTRLDMWRICWQRTSPVSALFTTLARSRQRWITTGITFSSSNVTSSWSNDGLAVTSRGDVRRKYAWLKNYHNRQVIQEMDTPHLDDYDPELEGTPRQFLDPLVLS